MGQVNYVQMHIGDFLTGVIHMDAVETGAYIMLIMAHYQSGEKGLPDDDKKLARIAKVGSKKWASIKDTIMEKFELSNSFWTQKRIVNELQRVKDKSSCQSAKALKRHNSPPATAQPRQCQPITNNQEPIKEEKESLDFEDFKNAYPRKDGLESARSCWSWAIQSGADPNQIVNAAMVYAETAHERVEDGKDFNLGAKKFIENKRYLDEDLQSEPSKPLELGELSIWQQSIVNKIGAVPFNAWFKGAELEDGVLLVSDSHSASFIREKFTTPCRAIFQHVEITN